MTTITAPPTAGAASTTVFAEIEAVLGFRPEHSLAIHVHRSRLPHAVLRIDLPPSVRQRTARTRGGSGTREPREITETEQFAHTVTGMVSKLSGAGSVELVFYHDQASWQLARFAYDVGERLHAAGFHLGGVYRVSAGAWSHLVATRSVHGWQFDECGVYSRLPPSVTRRTPAAKSSPGSGALGGSADHDSHHGPFVPVARPSQRRLARAMAAVAALERRQLAPERELVDELLEWQNLLAPDAAPPSDARAIAVAWSLRTTSVRDCVLMLCAWGFEAAVVSALDAARDADTDPGADPGASDVRGDGLLESVLGTGSRAPAPEQLRRSIDVLRSVAERVPDSLAAPVFSMLAWLEWCRGRGSAAAGYLEAATTADDSYLLAQLLRQMMGSGRLPEWIA